MVIKNGATLRKCYLLSFRYKIVQDIGICLRTHFHKKCLGNSSTNFSLILANREIERDR